MERTNTTSTTASIPSEQCLAAYEVGIRLAQLECLFLHFAPRPAIPDEPDSPLIFPLVHERNQVERAVVALRDVVVSLLRTSQGRQEVFLAVLNSCHDRWKSLDGPIGEAANFLEFANDRSSLQISVSELFTTNSGSNNSGKWFELGQAIAFGDPIDATDGQLARSSEEPIVWSVYQEKSLKKLVNELKLESDTLLPKVDLSLDVSCWLPYHPNTYLHWFRIEAGLRGLCKTMPLMAIEDTKKDSTKISKKTEKTPQRPQLPRNESVNKYLAETGKTPRTKGEKIKIAKKIAGPSNIKPQSIMQQAARYLRKVEKWEAKKRQVGE